MIQNALKEDKRPQNLYVMFSKEIMRLLENVYAYNQNNINALSQLSDYLDGLRNYISNPVIAWDYTNKYSRYPNGTIYMNDFDYNVGYSIITDKATGLPCVYVFKLNLDLEAFGLKMPPLKEESLFSVTKSDIKNMVMESVCRIILKESKCDYHVGKYEVVNGLDEHDISPRLYDSLKKFGWVYDVKMYFSHDDTYCLLRREDNKKLFLAKIVPAPELGEKKTKFVPCRPQPKEVPQIILLDVKRFCLAQQERYTM